MEVNTHILNNGLKLVIREVTAEDARSLIEYIHQVSGEFGITVQRKYWGTGIGSLMIDALIAWAKNTGIIKKINLRVRTDNERAILLYEQKGFVKEGVIRKEICIDCKFYDHYWMNLE